MRKDRDTSNGEQLVASILARTVSLSLPIICGQITTQAWILCVLLRFDLTQPLMVLQIQETLTIQSFPSLKPYECNKLHKPRLRSQVVSQKPRKSAVKCVTDLSDSLSGALLRCVMGAKNGLYPLLPSHSQCDLWESQVALGSSASLVQEICLLN